MPPILEPFTIRPRAVKMTVVFDGDITKPQPRDIADQSKFQGIKVEGRHVTKAVITIDKLMPATNGNGKSVAITEIEFKRRRTFGNDDFESLPAPAVATSTAQDGAAYLTDDDLDTAWTSLNGGDNGMHETITATFPKDGVDIDRIRIAPGHGKSPDGTDEFRKSPRPADIAITFVCNGKNPECDISKTKHLEDKSGYVTINVKERGVTAITIEAVTVHRKDKDEHGGVAFAEVQFQQRRKKSGG